MMKTLNISILDRLEAGKASNISQIEKNHKTTLKHLEDIETNHPRFAELFFAHTDASRDLSMLFSEHYFNVYPDINNIVNFVYSLIHYHIEDDGGYFIHPHYFDEKLQLEKDRQDILDDKDDENQLRKLMDLHKRNLPKMFITEGESDYFQEEEGIDCEFCDYEVMLKYCKEFYDVEHKEEVDRKKRHLEIFGFPE